MNIHRVLLSCIAALLYISCASTEKAPQYPTRLADKDPFSIGYANASVDRSFSSSVRPIDIDVFFHPRTNEVVLEFRHGVSYYKQIWNQAGRQQFIKAINEYKDDFTNQKLTTRYNKTRTIYGKVKGRFIWEPLKISPEYRSSPLIDLGYRFRDGSPYFSVYQRIASEETKINKDGVTESPAYSLYFTRAQAEDLAHLFNQDLLLILLGPTAPPAGAESARDLYIEK